MNYCIVTVSALVLLWPSHNIYSQSTFQNLNFEEANPVSAGEEGNPSAVTAASAFPGWSVYAGNTQLTVVNYNDPDLGSTTVGLVGPSSLVFPAIDGNYSVLLQGGLTASGASISQTGFISAGVQTLFFEGEPQFSSDTLNLLIGNQNVPFTALGMGVNYTLYAANISTWAGTTEQLTFSAPGVNDNWVIDDISFSSAAVPEPSVIVLSGIGGLICAMLQRLWSKRTCFS